MRLSLVASVVLGFIFFASAARAGVDLSKLHSSISAVCPIDGVGQFDPISDSDFAALPSKWPTSVFVRRADGGAWRLDVQPAATSEQITAAQAVAAAFDPTAAANQTPVYVPGATMLARLTSTEYLAIMQASAAQLTAGNPQLSQWIDQVRLARQGVNLSDPVTLTAEATLISSGLLTSDRAAVVFAAP